MDESERKRAAVRYDYMQWAIRNGERGEHVEAILARAQLYADFVLSEGILPAGMIDQMQVDSL